MNVYEIVTNQVIDLLSTGTVPWRKPWTVADAPRNLVSKKPYRGINVFLLSATKYMSPYWLTYNQAKDLGGFVRAGEKSTMVVFWKVDAKRDPDAQEGEISSADRTRVVLKYYRVFNLEQCDLPEKVLAKLPKPVTNDNPPIDIAETIIADMPGRPSMATGKLACYSPAMDCVTLPARDSFNTPQDYYATAFHELSHSTGHKSRLDRDGVTNPTKFGSHEYSKEELVAEMGAAFLCAESGILPAVIENQASYIASWLKALKGDSRLVVSAAAQSQKAADYILDRTAEKAADIDLAA